MKWIATAVLAAGSFGIASTDAAAEHDSAPRFTAPVINVQSCAPRIYPTVQNCSPRVRYDRRQSCRPVPRRVWVAPVYRNMHVGYDRCGNHIHRQVLVRAGYWRTVYGRRYR